MQTTDYSEKQTTSEYFGNQKNKCSSKKNYFFFRRKKMYLEKKLTCSKLMKQPSALKFQEKLLNKILI